MYGPGVWVQYGSVCVVFSVVQYCGVLCALLWHNFVCLDVEIGEAMAQGVQVGRCVCVCVLTLRECVNPIHHRSAIVCVGLLILVQGCISRACHGRSCWWVHLSTGASIVPCTMCVGLCV